MSYSPSHSSLNSLPPNIIKPKYKFEDIKPGIIHIGTGNFHRAHQGLYLDDLFNLGIDQDWGIVGSGIMSQDEIMRKALEKQDYLSTIVELNPNEYKVRVSGSMIDFLPVEENNNALIEALKGPWVRIVSMTITEGGYFLDNVNETFNIEDPIIVLDSKNIENPKSVFGVLVNTLNYRKKSGIPPYTIMSCDNLPGNGNITKNAVVRLAESIDNELSKWICLLYTSDAADE